MIATVCEITDESFVPPIVKLIEFPSVLLHVCYGSGQIDGILVSGIVVAGGDIVEDALGPDMLFTTESCVE